MTHELTPQDWATYIAIWVAFFGAIFLYWVPGMIACMRKHRDAGAINVLNLFLGWTLIGWVVALVWAFTGNVKEVSK